MTSVETIRLDAVLAEAVASARHLVTRATGRAVRSRLEHRLRERAGAAVCLDFAAVGLVDFSCADEVVAQLLLAGDGHGCFVLLAGLRADHRDAIEQVLHHHRLVVALVDATPALLGPADDDERAAFTLVATRGGAAAGEVAAALGWEAPRAAQALGRLAARRVVRPAGPDAVAALAAVA